MKMQPLTCEHNDPYKSYSEHPRQGIFLNSPSFETHEQAIKNISKDIVSVAKNP
jgi:hypothetical protein